MEVNNVSGKNYPYLTLRSQATIDVLPVSIEAVLIHNSTIHQTLMNEPGVKTEQLFYYFSQFLKPLLC